MKITICEPGTDPTQEPEQQDFGLGWRRFLSFQNILIVILASVFIIGCLLSRLGGSRASTSTAQPATETATPMPIEIGLITFTPRPSPTPTVDPEMLICTCVTITPTPRPDCWPYIEVLLTRMPDLLTMLTPTPTPTASATPTQTPRPGRLVPERTATSAP